VVDKLLPHFCDFDYFIHPFHGAFNRVFSLCFTSQHQDSDSTPEISGSPVQTIRTTYIDPARRAERAWRSGLMALYFSSDSDAEGLFRLQRVR
jgi:hypothetical protein